MRARLIALTGVITLAGALAAAPPALGADRLPDLGMARIGDLRVDKAGGQRLLRYTTIVVNVGTGPFVATGSRSSTAAQEMAV